MSHLQFPKLLTRPRILRLRHLAPTHHDSSTYSQCRQQALCRAEALHVCKMLPVHPDVGNPLESPSWGVVWLTRVDAGPHLTALSLQSPCYVTHKLITPLWMVLRHKCSGEAHLSGIVLKVQPKVNITVALVSNWLIWQSVRAWLYDRLPWLAECISSGIPGQIHYTFLVCLQQPNN